MMRMTIASILTLLILTFSEVVSGVLNSALGLELDPTRGVVVMIVFLHFWSALKE